jgi:hypothetical protein
MPIRDSLERGTLKEETDPLFHVRDVAVGAGLLAAVFTFLEKEDFVTEINKLLDGKPDYVYLWQLATLGALVYLAVRWYYHGTEELRQLQRWLSPARFHAQHPIAQYFAIVGVGIFMAVLGVFNNHILFFSLIFSVYLVVDFLSWKLRRREIATAIYKSRAALSKMNAALPWRSPSAEKDRRTIDVYMRAADHLETFYSKRPHYCRLAVEIILMSGVCASVYALRLADTDAAHHPFLARFTTRLLRLVSNDDGQARRCLRGTFYLFFITLLLTSEALIGRWRRVMRSWLTELDEQLDLIDERAEPSIAIPRGVERQSRSRRKGRRLRSG